MRPTLHQTVQKILANEFRMQGSYRNWRPAGTRDWLFIYTFAGRGTYRNAAGEVYRSEEGHCTLYEPGAWQQYETDKSAGEWGLLWAHFQPYAHWRAWLDWPQKWKGFRTLSILNPQIRKEIAADMKEVIQCCRSGLPVAGDLGLNGMEKVLLEIEADRRGHPLGKLDERILKAVNWLSLHFQKSFSVESLARECGLSPSRFAHLFKSQTGTSPQRMVEENRMRHASRMLLSTGLTVAEVAEESGYESPFYFTQRFHLFFGKSPRDFRREKEDAGKKTKRRRR